jgi:hypothetical protein
MKNGPLIVMSVAFAVGPSVNTLKAQLVLPSEPNFCNLFEYPTRKSTQKSISHLTLKIVK